MAGGGDIGPMEALELVVFVFALDDNTKVLGLRRPVELCGFELRIASRTRSKNLELSMGFSLKFCVLYGELCFVSTFTADGFGVWDLDTDFDCVVVEVVVCVAVLPFNCLVCVIADLVFI